MNGGELTAQQGCRPCAALQLTLPAVLSVCVGEYLEWPSLLTGVTVVGSSLVGAWAWLGRMLPKLDPAAHPDTLELQRALERETTLRQNTEAFVQRLIDVIPDPVYVKGPDSGYLLVNQAFADYHQQSREYLTSSAYPPEGPVSQVRYTSREEDVRVLAGAEISKEEDVIRKATGERVCRIVHKRRSVYFDGRPVVIGIDHNITRWRVAEQALQQLAQQDPLTGMANRRHFQALAGQLLERLARYPEPLALILIDLDHFKLVNDRFGHHAGDQVLVQTTLRLKDALRRADIPGRWGGEEFIILLPRTGLDEAQQVAERLRHALAASPLGCDAGEIRITLSAGVAGFRSGETLDCLIARADAALYVAKAEGRDRVSIA